MTTYIMNDLEFTTLKRSQYLAASILELRVLGKLYGIRGAGEGKHKVNWVDSLVAFMPHPVCVWNLGLIHNDSRHCLADVKNGSDIFAAVNTFNAPSIIERAIIGRLIELGCDWKDYVWFPPSSGVSDGFKVVHKTLHPDEIHVIDKVWSIYKIKKHMNEVELQLTKNWSGGNPDEAF